MKITTLEQILIIVSSIWDWFHDMFLSIFFVVMLRNSGWHEFFKNVFFMINTSNINWLELNVKNMSYLCHGYINIVSVLKRITFTYYFYEWLN